MCNHLFAQLLAHGGPEQKAIVFCVRDSHAEEVARRLRDLYRDWCQAQGIAPKQDYAFRCTQKAGDAKSTTADLRGSVTSHFVACTVELLSTGVDVPVVQNIVFFKYLSSPILFAQMLGRGTRLHAETEKLMFRVFDYTGATDLFGFEYKAKLKKKPGPVGGGKGGPTPPPPKQVEGVTIRVEPTGRYLIAVVDGEPRKISVEEYRQRLAARLLHFAPDLAGFRARWLVPDLRHELLAGIVQSGLSPKALAEIEELQACDLFDVLGEVGYALQRRTRAERAFMFHTKNARWLAPLPLPAQATLKAIANQFGKGGTEALESAAIWDAPEVARAGGLAVLKQLGKPHEIIDETKERLFVA
jgi:type I restriction enzyme R subunit